MTNRETAFLILGLIVGGIWDPESFWLSVVAKLIVGLIGIVIIHLVSERTTP